MPDGLYDRDILLWSEQQADLLRRAAAGEALRAQIDWENVIEEVGSAGRAALYDCEGALVRAMMLLLSLRSLPDDPMAPEWRDQAKRSLDDARARYVPVIQRYIDLDVLYARTVKLLRRAESDVGLPATCPFRLDELLGASGAVADVLGAA